MSLLNDIAPLLEILAIVLEVVLILGLCAAVYLCTERNVYKLRYPVLTSRESEELFEGKRLGLSGHGQVAVPAGSQSWVAELRGLSAHEAIERSHVIQAGCESFGRVIDVLRSNIPVLLGTTCTLSALYLLFKSGTKVEFTHLGHAFGTTVLGCLAKVITLCFGCWKWRKAIGTQAAQVRKVLLEGKEVMYGRGCDVASDGNDAGASDVLAIPFKPRTGAGERRDTATSCGAVAPRGQGMFLGGSA